jgi:hypothetical protein
MDGDDWQVGMEWDMVCNSMKKLVLFFSIDECMSCWSYCYCSGY